MTNLTRFLLAAALAGAGAVLGPRAAHAQRTDSTSTVKPQLNTAPPGAAPRPQAPAPTPDRTVPAPPPAEQPVPTPAPRPTPDRPSGLDFPQPPATGTGRAAQDNVPARRLFLYSNFGLGFSSIYGFSRFSASLAPAVGYRFTERFAAGPGISYSYLSLSQRGGGSIKTNSVGLKGFAQFIVFDQFFVHGEYEVTRAELLYQDQNTGVIFPGKTTVTTPLLGAGYRQQFSDRAAADIVLLYNFNDGLNDIYGQPVIRFSFLFDLK